MTRSIPDSRHSATSSLRPSARQRANGVPLQIFADQAADNLRRIVGNQVGIRDISISRLDYDDSTKSKINQLNAERANTATAEQAVKTAEENRKANEILATSHPKAVGVNRELPYEVHREGLEPRRMLAHQLRHGGLDGHRRRRTNYQPEPNALAVSAGDRRAPSPIRDAISRRGLVSEQGRASEGHRRCASVDLARRSVCC
jgi:hypothetical protein